MRKGQKVTFTTRISRPLSVLAGILAMGGALSILALSLHVQGKYQDRMFSAASVPPAPVALVFGAGLSLNGVPSPILAERLITAINLYKAGKVRKLLVSGDNATRAHDETKAMRRFAILRGVPSAAVVGDYAGFSTYETCFRAKAIFGVSRAILVTQRYHLPRALFVANSLGIDADGVAAGENSLAPSHYRLREFLSRAWAAVMVWVRPKPHFLGPPETIE